MNHLELKNISVQFNELAAVNSISLELNTGEIGCLLGPSGCGKTTVLRAIAGFEQLHSGEIFLHEQKVSSPDISISTEQRRVGMVFQDFALFPHLNIEQNVMFGLNHLDTAARHHRVEELLQWTELNSLANKYPHQLSGGQQQRVALARAIAPKPSVLLLDEPFSNIDIELREHLARDIRKLLKAENITGLLVTHDQNEAFLVADKIGVLNKGKLHQWDDGYQLYHQPKDLFVADFIGRGVFLPGKAINNDSIETDFGVLQNDSDKTLKAGDNVQILIRPDDIVHDDDSPQFATVVEKTFQGADFLYTLEMQNGRHVLCFAPSHHDHDIGEAIGIRVELDHLVVFKGIIK